MKKLFLTLILVLFVIPIGISQDLPSYIPTDGLVAYYPFNGNANDESGNGHHGTVNGATLKSDRNDVQNSSYGFDGLDDYISINSNNNQLDFFGNCCLTISAWINLDNTDNQYGILTNTVSNNIHQQYALKVDSNSKLYFLAGDGLFESNGFNYSSSDINNGQWTHTLVSYDGNKLKLYLNGNLDYENQIIDNFPESPSSVAFIGNSWGSNNDFFPGQIDDVGIWNRALTEKEIQKLFNSSTGDILLNGTVSAENNQIRNVADPTHTQDAATKGYVDSNVNSFSGSYNDLTDTPTSSNAFQLPLVTTDQRDEITPQSGMMVYNIDVHEFQGFQNYEKIHPAEIDQQHVTINNGGGENRAQSFTAGVTGELELVKLPLNVMMEPVELLFKIIEGEGVDGNVLFETSYNLTNSDQNWIEFSISGVDVISGNKYTIQIIENSGCGMPPCYIWGMDTSGDNYIGGQFFYNGTPYSNGDYDSAFITYVSLREAVNEWRTLH